MLNRRKRRNDFEHIVLPHVDALYGSACRLTRNPRDAEDLVQDTMLRAYRHWHTFKEDSNCKAWLFRILTNTFINGYQKRKRAREVLSAAAAEQEATDGVLVQQDSFDQRDPESLLIGQSMSDDVASALDSLPPDFRVAVVLCDVEGFSYKEIAEIMECPVGTVMSRLHRGRRLLKSALHDYALAQGIIKPANQPTDSQSNPSQETSSSTSEQAGADTIDLASYRQRRR